MKKNDKFYTKKLHKKKLLITFAPDFARDQTS